MTRSRFLIGLLLVVALIVGADQGMRAAADMAAANAVAAAATAAGSTAAPAAAPAAKATATAAAAAPQKAQKKGRGRGAQTLGPQGQTGQMRSTTQAQRRAARRNQRPQATGTAATFAGIKPATATLSPLAAAGTPGGPITLAAMTPGATPDYFGVPNFANSPLPAFAGGTVAIPTVVGNPLIARAYPTDTATNVFVTLPTLLPSPGTLTAFQTYVQPGSVGTFNAYVLRPTTVASQYTVVFDSGLLTVPASTGIATYPVAPFTVLAGDLIAFYGYGIPIDIGTGTDLLFYPAPAAPIVGSTIDLTGASAGFPLYPQARTYSFGANVTVSQPTGAITGGMRKFVDQLPSLPIAVPDTATFPGSDYYEISLVEYNQVMHSDLALANGGLGTKLRGYVQTNGPLGLAQKPQYLGPVIVATKNRPVRIRFTNALPIGAGGNLFIPTDTTYMGSGAGPDGTAYSQNRAVLHLHGGNTPWISDGTPHQWTAPKGEPTNFKKGVSTSSVPDMWFDASGNLLPASSGCQGHRTCAVAGATNNPGDGSITFYYTNQQSGRLMFYHDHAYGITRLNVYAGEAAGYLVADPVEEDGLAAASVPGTIGTTPDLAHMIPLVIQDKTFVPDDGTAPGSQLAATDPTWDTTKWGGFGNLWFPHVYTPNQNPYDPSGANPYGRWDYGPWFWPPMNPATLVSLPFPCGPTLSSVCPGTPTVSGTPEAFMDTPVVNGMAYPALTVDPAAYRFRILNAANDRTLNLGLYVADNLTVAVTNPGAGYSASAPPAVSFVPAGGSTAGLGTATAIVSTGVVTDISVVSGGGTYGSAPAITIDPPVGCTINTTTCIQATAIATVSATAGLGGGQITSIAVTNGGAGYTSVPNVTIAGNLACVPLASPNCDVATANITSPGQILGVTVTGASGWTAAPSVFIAAPPSGGLQAAAVASVNTEVKMVPAAAPTTGSPLQACATLTPITTIGLGTGLATSNIYDGVGNITGLPQNCWPVYSRDPGLPAPVMWPTDGRQGGVPDPTTAGPPIIQIGTEGGLLPAAAVIPSTPTSYEYNRRSITVLNIGVHGLLVGPAERADIVVDFTKFAGKTLIVYNDAPAPVPAFDPRSDYYTGDPDETGTGGAPTTLPGYGPNIRTVMQINVAPVAVVPGSHSLNVAALQAALPGIFAGTTAAPNQDPPIVNPGVFARIQDTALVNGTGGVTGVTMAAGGSGYKTPPTVQFVPAGATGTATLGGGPLASIVITNPGALYTTAPTVTIAAPPAPGVRATATATIAGGHVTAITLTNPGSGYPASPMPAVTISAPTGNPSRNRVTATATATWAGGPVTGVTISIPGTYSAIPSVFFTCTAPCGKGALGTPTLSNSFPLVPKTIQELFTLDYGRMNATLGVELPFTNFLTQTTIPYGYIDPPTEIFKDGETQLWKITHNGVDTHFIHFHLFNVQVVNRVGWDGAIKPPDANELGWKDTVRMNPLEDIVVALKAMKQTTFAPTDLDVSNLPNSVRPLDVTMPLGTSGQFTDVDPTNQPAVVTNDLTNFGWEYVWHCHILGHEENDMMRAMVMLVPPAAPGIPSAVLAGTLTSPRVVVSWANNAANATGFIIERAVVIGGVTQPGTRVVVGTVPGTTFTFTDTTVARRTTYVYQVTATNTVGYTKAYAAPAVGYPNQTASSLPVVSNTVTTR